MATLAPLVTVSKKGVESRKRILNAAAGLFSRRGYGGTSMRDISQACDLKVAAIYHYFPSKEDLLLSVESEAFSFMTAHVNQAVGREKDPWMRIEAACVAHMQGVLDNREYINVTTRELPDNHSAAVRQQLRYQRESYENIFRKLVDDLPLPRSVNKSMLRLTLLGAMAWSLVWFRPGRGSPETAAREMLKIIRFGAE
jgi:TetR/AcrR family transcriptional regulator, cholesterol catabolism regulator